MKNKCIDIKESKALVLSTSSQQATSLHFITVLLWFEIIARFMTNLKEKCECSSCGDKFNQKWASLLIYNNNFLKI